MIFGIYTFPTDESFSFPDLARLTEQRGFQSLFVGEHTHMPLKGRDSYAGRAKELPRAYSRLLDPFVALTAAASATRELRIGTAVCLVAHRDPIVTAKQVATLDFISGGRFEFGIGAGWQPAQAANHGFEFAQRFRRLDEHMQAINAIWSSECASYHGTSVSFDEIESWPKPVQRPRPPVLVGGNGPQAVNRVLALGDGWLPNRLPKLGERIVELRRRAAELGKARPTVTYLFPYAGETVPLLRELEAAGVDRVLLMADGARKDELEQRLDALAGTIAQLH